MDRQPGELRLLHTGFLGWHVRQEAAVREAPRRTLAVEDLALSCRRDGRYEMFLTAAPINVPGGIGSPANALAIK